MYRLQFLCDNYGCPHGVIRAIFTVEIKSCRCERVQTKRHVKTCSADDEILSKSNDCGRVPSSTKVNVVDSVSLE